MAFGSKGIFERVKGALGGLSKGRKPREAGEGYQL
jgi:hypothetical protein